MGLRPAVSLKYEYSNFFEACNDQEDAKWNWRFERAGIVDRGF